MPVISFKRYACNVCGKVKSIDTNHTGECYSVGNYNRCPVCTIERPFTSTVWLCLEPEPGQFMTYKEAKLTKFLGEG